MREEGGRWVINSPITGGSPPDAAYLLLSDGRTVLNVMNLTATDYQRLSAADKAKLETDGVFTTHVAVRLGLAPRLTIALLAMTSRLVLEHL